MDRTLIFSTDPLYSKQLNNNKTVYMYSRWEQYGYLEFVSYADYLNILVKRKHNTKLRRKNITKVFKLIDMSK